MRKEKEKEEGGGEEGGEGRLSRILCWGLVLVRGWRWGDWIALGRFVVCCQDGEWGLGRGGWVFTVVVIGEGIGEGMIWVLLEYWGRMCLAMGGSVLEDSPDACLSCIHGIFVLLHSLKSFVLTSALFAILLVGGP